MYLTIPIMVSFLPFPPLSLFISSLCRVEYTTTQTPQERASSVDLISPSAFVVANIAPQSYQVRTEPLPCLYMSTSCNMRMMIDTSARLWRIVARLHSMHIMFWGNLLINDLKYLSLFVFNRHLCKLEITINTFYVIYPVLSIIINLNLILQLGYWRAASTSTKSKECTVNWPRQ